jgi:glycosyltransferase involved in cell wall biosynthesis
VAESMLKVSAVIPAYFEEKTISYVVERCLVYVDEVLVVNDGSSDDTSINAAESGARVIELKKNMGVVKAIQTGISEASGDIIVTLDADGQHDPDEIPKLIEPIIIGEADLVMGKRPYFPCLSEKILTGITSLRVPCCDASTGFRAIRSEIAKKMTLYGECLCGTFVLEAARNGARVSCVPISIHEREGPRRIQTRHFNQFFILLRKVISFR